MFGKFDKSRLVPDQPGDVAGYIYAFTPDEQDPHYSVIDVAGVLDADGNIIRSTRPGILVNTRTSDQIQADEKERQRKQKEREEAERKDDERKNADLAKLGREFDKELNKPARFSPFGASGSAGANALKSLTHLGVKLPDLDQHERELKHPQPGVDYDPIKAMPVFAAGEPIKMMRSIISNSPDSDRLKARLKLYEEIQPLGNMRQLGAPASIEALEDLGHAFPHFREVIILIRNQIKLAARAKRALKLPPILLLGEAGVGKTEFTHQLARLFGSPMERLAYDNDQTGSALLGAAKHWSNAEPGEVFKALVKGTHANPVMLLDEIDKVHRSEHRGDPLASLHTLLESSTHHAVKDVSVDFTLDASHVIWIATANDRRGVKSTILSRFTEFTIHRPTGQHSIQLAQAVAERIHAEMKLEDFDMPKPELIRLLADYTPREQGKAWRYAYATAVSADRNEVRKQDLPKEIISRMLIDGAMRLPPPNLEEGGDDKDDNGNKGGKGDRPAPSR